MRFAIPSILWMLVFLPAIGFGLYWAMGQRRRLMMRFGSSKNLDVFSARQTGVLVWVRMALVLLGVASLVVALARPQWGYHERQVVTRGVDLVVAIDTSASMMARDFEPSRMERAKDLLRNMIWEARGDRIGIVAFAGSAAVICPLTLDYKMASTALKAVSPNTVSARGTDIGAAIRSARGAFETASAADRVMVLLTDGEQLERLEELEKEIGLAKEAGIRIFAIGLGTEDGSVIPTMRGPLQTESGEIVKTNLDFEMLERIAEQTQGRAIRAEKMGAGEIAEISAELAQFRGRKQQDKTFRVYHERYPIFIGIALVLLALEAVLRSMRTPWWQRRRGAVAAGMVAAGLIVGCGDVWAYPGEGYVRSRDALQRYHAGDYDEAAELYDEAARLDPKKQEILYNYGSAAAKSGKHDAAMESFRKVYDPENPELTALARFGLATTEHRQVRTRIMAEKERWAAGVAGGDEEVVAEVKEAIEVLKRAIQDYKDAILAKPDDVDMKANYEIAKRDLQELEEMLKQNPDQEEQQQEEQPQENEQQEQDPQDSGEDDQGEGEQQDGQQNQDDEQGEGQDDEQQQDKPQDESGDQDGEQGKDGDEERDDQGQDQPGKDGDDGDEEERDAEPDDNGQQPAPTPTPTPTPTPGPGQDGQSGGTPDSSGQQVPVGEMSLTDVDRLLNTLPPEDQRALQLLMGSPTEDEDMEHTW